MNKALLESNLRLVKMVANQYSRSGIDYDELVDLGLLGLTKAEKKYDPNRGVKFSSYAVHWIRGEIKTNLKKVRHTISLNEEAEWESPEGTPMDLENLERYISFLSGDKRKIICDYFGIGGYTRKVLREIARDVHMSISSVWRLKQLGLSELKQTITCGQIPKKQKKSKPSRQEYQKRYRESHGDSIKRQLKAWRREHPGYYDDWLKKHPDYHEEWEEKHRTRRKNYKRSYMKEYMRKYRSKKKAGGKISDC